MGVDESRSDNQTAGLDYPPGPHARTVADEDDAVAANTDVGDARGVSGAVVHGTVPNQDIDAVLALSKGRCDQERKEVHWLFSDFISRTTARAPEQQSLRTLRKDGETCIAFFRASFAFFAVIEVL